MKQLDKKVILKNCIVTSFVGLFFVPLMSFFIGAMLLGMNYKDPSDLFSHTFFFQIAIFYLLFLLLTWIIAKYSHYFYRYELEKEALKIEKGIIWKKYISIPYSKIQNVDVSRGIWDRILKLSTLHIQTAGLSYPAPAGQEGKIPGLSIQTAKDLQADLTQRVSSQSNNASNP